MLSLLQNRGISMPGYEYCACQWISLLYFFVVLLCQRKMSTNLDDIVAVGGNLEPAALLSAYQRGVFPWPGEGLPLLWYCPRQRAILDLKNLHVGRNLLRAKRKSGFEFTIDRAFSEVLHACAEIPRAEQEGTWITGDMIAAYEELHRLGHAHSVEAWNEGQLVGGLYGVDPGGVFCGESMFHLEPDASHLALLYLLEHVEQRGLTWIDIQVMTPHMGRLGAGEIPRNEFVRRLEDTLELNLELFEPAARQL